MCLLLLIGADSVEELPWIGKASVAVVVPGKDKDVTARGRDQPRQSGRCRLCSQNVLHTIAFDIDLFLHLADASG